MQRSSHILGTVGFLAFSLLQLLRRLRLRHLHQHLRLQQPLSEVGKLIPPSIYCLLSVVVGTKLAVGSWDNNHG